MPAAMSSSAARVSSDYPVLLEDESVVDMAGELDARTVAESVEEVAADEAPTVGLGGTVARSSAATVPSRLSVTAAAATVGSVGDAVDTCAVVGLLDRDAVARVLTVPVKPWPLAPVVDGDEVTWLHVPEQLAL